LVLKLINKKEGRSTPLLFFVRADDVRRPVFNRL
jgi:hypothetical protein